MSASETLRQAGPQIAALSAHIRAVAGDDDVAWLDTLDGEVDAISVARIVVREIIETQATAGALKDVATGYTERRTRLEARGDRLRAALLRFMQDIDARSLPLPEATLTVSAGQPRLIGEPDADMLPDEYVKTKREADKAAIRQALVDGLAVHGMALSNAEPRLTMRVK